MAEVKWIKITTDIFDDEKIILIESLPDAYAIISIAMLAEIKKKYTEDQT